jgi:non-canonical poly(A) RNA polymerase PAPD5/7
VRQDIATRIQTTIQAWYHGRGVQIYCFGSYPAGLYLPNADMDLVALSPRYLESAVPTFCLGMPDKRKLRSVLRSAGVFDPVKGADIIAFAKVPLIKFTDLQTGLKVDISFENHTGLTAQGTLQTWKEQFPDMPVLVALIKQFLCMRNLNEVFHGGIGGFTIICLVVSMLQHMPEVQAGNHEPHTRYGDLLLNFFDLYGNKFNYRDTGIIMEPPSYFDKLRDRDRMNIRYQDDRLTIIDPNRADNDISGGSRLIAEVFDCFRGAHALMQRRLNQIRLGKANSESILECILGGNYSTYFDTRARIRRVYQRNHPDGDADLVAQETRNSMYVPRCSY